MVRQICQTFATPSVPKHQSRYAIFGILSLGHPGRRYLRGVWDQYGLPAFHLAIIQHLVLAMDGLASHKHDAEAPPALIRG
jgi:hypothetical protein